MAVSPGCRARRWDPMVAHAYRARVEVFVAADAASFPAALPLPYAARWRRTTGRCFLPARNSTSIAIRTPG